MLTAWIVTLLLGAAQATANRFYMNPDGIDYLDLSDAYARGDYRAAVNSYWSPLYSWIIGQLRRLHPWDPYWESTSVHVVNLVIYLISFACFLYMLRELRSLQRSRKSESVGRQIIQLDGRWEMVWAYGLFLWAALILIGLGEVTPDMCIAAEVYLIAGIMVRAIRVPVRWLHPVVLGAVLGLSYVTKAVMFPVSFLVIASAGWGKGAARWTAFNRLVCLLAFLIVGAPQLIAVSQREGRPSFGENGRHAYAKRVNLYPRFWIGNPPNSGVPVHPVKKIMTSPEAYEFPNAQPGSAYPFSFDPAYWAKGIRPHFDLGQQRTAIREQLVVYGAIFPFPFFACLALWLMAVRRRRLEVATICIPAVGVLVLYALVHAEPRLVAPWAVVLVLCFVCSLEFSEEPSAYRSVRAILVTLSICLLASGLLEFYWDAHMVVRILNGRGPSHQNWIVASSLRKLGLRPGQKVASIGRSSNSYWARLAGVQIGMEIPEEASDSFWKLSDSAKVAVLGTLESHGAQMVVAYPTPKGVANAPWVALGQPSFYAIHLPRR